MTICPALPPNLENATTEEMRLIFDNPNCESSIERKYYPNNSHNQKEALQTAKNQERIAKYEAEMTGGRIRLNKKRSNKKRSNKKRSNKKRSNKKRSNKKRNR